MILDRATERLRSKHVRTLELLQQTLDENEDLRDRLAKAQQVCAITTAGVTGVDDLTQTRCGRV